MRILAVGAGATGGYFGGRLAQAGRDVTFLVRPARAEQLRASGLVLVSPAGNVTLKPALVTASTIPGPYDVVLLAVKAFSLDQVLGDLGPAVGPETMVLPVLNGMKHMGTLVERFGPRVVGGLCRINTTVDGQGRIVQLNPLQELWYGERDGSTSARILRLDAAFKNAGFDALLTDGIEAKMWEKWTLLATLGGIVCLMRGNLGEVARVPGGTAFSLGFFDEVLAVVRAAGHPPTEDFVAETHRWLVDPASVQTTSMYRDLSAGNPVEADQIVGDLVTRAQRLGVPTPLVSAAYAHLSVYQNRRAAVQ